VLRKSVTVGYIEHMVRYYIVKTASFLMLSGFAFGIIGQGELLRPGIAIISPELWIKILPLHVWLMAISLVIICLSTISLIRDRTTLGQWAIWLGLSERYCLRDGDPTCLRYRHINGRAWRIKCFATDEV